MGERGDIIRTLNRELGLAKLHRPPQDHAIYDPHRERSGPLVGRVVSRGLSDEHADRRFVIIDGIDGLTHYVDIGQVDTQAPPGAVLSVASRPAELREADRTVAAVAAANGGRYSIDIHLMHDPGATDAFATAHVRRLEAIRLSTGAVEREADGTWIIAPDHLERVGAYERSIIARNPVLVEVLSDRPIERLAEHDGATWLDRELVAPAPARLERGFGAEVREAQARRRQWLIDQGLAEPAGEAVHYRPDMIETLERRELRRVGAALARELGSSVSQADAGERVEGVYARAVQVGDRKFALVQRSHDFALVPWRPVLERHLGRDVSGVVRENGSISWTIGRSRGLSIS
jgi:hypothetical protein